MGGAVSAGENNAELVDNLVDADYIKTGIVEKVFRAVDRGDYYLPEHRDSAYKDLAWKHGNIHLSAPCIYAEVLENLEIGPGMSFLNLGSGTGYLNTMVGLIIGPYGVNHGVECHADVIEYAQQHVDMYCKTGESFDEFEFCPPSFTRGNCLLLASGSRLYDRLYCGAACPPEYENYMKNLIKVGGILVMPLSDQLLQIRRTSETTWETKNVLPVSFASLIMPTGPVDHIDLSPVNAMSLQDICRVAIRRILRRNIQIENPQLGCKRVRPAKRRTPREKRHRINLVPMQAGLMVLGQFGGDSDGEVELGREFEREVGDLEDMRQATRRRLQLESNEEEQRVEDTEEERQRQDDMETERIEATAVQEKSLDLLTRVEDDVEDDVDAGFEEEISETSELQHDDDTASKIELKTEGNINGNSIRSNDNEKLKTENGNSEEMVKNFDDKIEKTVEDSATGGINITAHQRMSSFDHISESIPGSNGFSAASYSSSGIGMCGSLENELLGVASSQELSSSPLNRRPSYESLRADSNGRLNSFPNVDDSERYHDDDNDDDEDDDDDDDMRGLRANYDIPADYGVTWRRPAANEPALPNIDDVLDFGRLIAARLNQRKAANLEVTSDNMAGVEEAGDEKRTTGSKAEGSEEGERSSTVTYRSCMRIKVEMLTLPLCLKRFVLFDRY